MMREVRFLCLSQPLLTQILLPIDVEIP
jgi:hypothetical protein